MDRATAARIEEWDERPVSGGYGGLGELADAGFTGAVTQGAAWLFMLNGRIVGAVDGTVDAFESGEATAYRAPDPGLPLLYAMQAAEGEPRAKYYTDDNPLREVHETLSEAGFTGYIELSENVLSGDYYVVYYGGKSMSVAFVGNAERLLTGDEAFREAADEVGIYQVVDVDLDVRNVPEPAEPAGAAAPTPEPEGAAEPEPEAAQPEPEPAPEAEASPEPEPEPAERAAEEPEEPEAPAEPEPAAPDPEAEPEPEPDPTPEAAGTAAEGTGEDEDPFSEEAAWRETRTIPALDPEESAPKQAAEDGGQHSEPAQREPQPEPDPQPAAEPEPAPEPDPVADDRIERLEAALEQQNETIERLESRLESSSAEAEELREERAALEDELEAARSAEDGGAAPAGERLDPDAALDQTDLFVRYGTKGGGTLEKAHDDKIERDEVVTNLRIDHHTRFEEGAVVIDGRGFSEWLESTLEYRFVDWLVTQLLFEIQDTGSQRGLREVFDAIPRIDRVEFKGTVTWRDPEAGETHDVDFDVVCRDRMGRALLVANLNDDRDPATGDMMGSLIEGSSQVAEGTETLGGAFMVTSSFFRPDALETASEATGGGLLSREKRWSYVKQARKAGYHLCLVEARGSDFHVAVPEL